MVLAYNLKMALLCCLVYIELDREKREIKLHAGSRAYSVQCSQIEIFIRGIFMNLSMDTCRLKGEGELN
jgi:hypothetical protein